ncbi:MAG: 16S rRNA (adenine(1518)-N(6)/adenine(1519)-N(6))-dimethyltransferase RsmA [Bacillota bacterium]|nr:16S rRNA (adenine(1518)-N(6)/adenine(1519)-N(6))-dimethyltransferase RsmA [Bacillota bacterium]
MSKIVNPSLVAKIMKERGFNTKKRFGQNFLIDQNIVNRIVNSAELEKDDWVIEIGPGLGALTTLMSEVAQCVVAMEIDTHLVSILEELIDQPNINIVEGDALAIDWEKCLTGHGWKDEPLKLVANLPYYLTTPLIMKALESDLPFKSVVVMVQKEVAERILAKPNSKDFGVLSLAVQYYSEPSLVANVPRTVFIPSPAVDSAVIKLKPISPLVDAPRKELFEVIRASFQQRRKTIRNALKPLIKSWGISSEQIDDALARAKIESNVRGECLALEDYGVLTKELMRGV